MASAAAIQAEGLTIKYRGKSEPALRDVSINVPPQSSVGIAGPNGSGKTTFLRAAAGLLQPAAGWIQVLGSDVVRDYRRVLRHVGYVPERAVAHPYLSGKEFLMMLYELGGGDPGRSESTALDTLKLAGLEDMAERRTKTYSHGMLRRLVLAQAMIHYPDVLLIDEPFIGLDIVGIQRLRGTLKDIQNRGKTVVLSSHALSEFEDLCDYLALFDRGQILAYAKTEQIRSDLSSMGIRSQFRLSFRELTSGLRQFLESMPFEVEVKGDVPVAVVTLTGARDEFDSLLRMLASAPEEVVAIEPVRPLLERAVHRALAREGL